MAKDSVSMPMASAGIIGFSSDTKISGLEVDPKALIIGVFAMVILVHVLIHVIIY